MKSIGQIISQVGLETVEVIVLRGLVAKTPAIELQNEVATHLSERLYPVPSLIDLSGYARKLVELFTPPVTGSADTARDAMFAAFRENPTSNINAIKHVRRATGWGLKEAKDWCEQQPDYQKVRNTPLPPAPHVRGCGEPSCEDCYPEGREDRGIL